MIRLFAFAESQASPGIGLGMERRVHNSKTVGHALTLDKKIVPAGLFTKTIDRAERRDEAAEKRRGI